MKKTTLFALTALIACSSRAQLAITPVTGLNVSNYRFTVGVPSVGQQKPLFGYCAGALVDIPLDEHISIQSGALYKLNGFKWETTETKETISMNTIDIPVKLVYSCRIGKGNALFIGAGPYVGINFSGKYHLVADYTFDSSNHTSGPRHVDQTFNFWFGRRLDIGAGASIGVKMRNGIFISAQAQYGIKDQGWESPAPMHFHNYNYGIVGGYRFKLNKHKTPAEAPAKGQ